MTRQTNFIQLSKVELSSLKTLFSGGSGSNRKHNRARIIGLLEQNKSATEIAAGLLANDCLQRQKTLSGGRAGIGFDGEVALGQTITNYR